MESSWQIHRPAGVLLGLTSGLLAQGPECTVITYGLIL